MGKESPITYSATGVNYDAMDPLKRLAQLRARETAPNLNQLGMQEVEASRGESAYVWDEGDCFRAFVVEGLGTKNRVADETRKITGRAYYEAIAQDTVAMIVNDLIVVGAKPQVVNAYFAVGHSDWFTDEQRTADLVNGWAHACNLAGAVWGGGETPTLKGIIEADTIDLSGAAVGIIKPKERLILGDKLTPGDSILLVESSGIHANGLTLAREIKSREYQRNHFLYKHMPRSIFERLENWKWIDSKEGYTARLSDGTMYGEALLTPTYIYAGLVRDLFDTGVDIHYMVNITGHGWRKLMRANRDLSYIIDKIPEPQPVFKFIQEKSGNDDEEMYRNFNMGAGFAVMLPKSQVEEAQGIAKENHNFQTWDAGVAKRGPKRVEIKPLGLKFEGKTLGVR